MFKGTTARGRSIAAILAIIGVLLLPAQDDCQRGDHACVVFRGKDEICYPRIKRPLVVDWLRKLTRGTVDLRYTSQLACEKRN